MYAVQLLAFDRFKSFKHNAKRESDYKAVVLMTQADPYFETWNAPPIFTRLLRVAPEASEIEGHRRFLAALESETLAFNRPVLFIHGDSHYFRIDKPLYDSKSKRMIEDLTRIESFGSPDVHWIRVTVDLAKPALFSARPELLSH